MTPLELPKQKTPPTTKDPRVLILYGAPKVGKTTILSELPNNLIVDLEEGTDFLSALKVNVHNMDELEQVAMKLRNPPGQYPYVSIDTVTAMEDWAEIRGTERYKKNPTGKNFDGQSVLELAHGHGYLWLRLAFQELLNMFSGTSTRLILVCQLREKFLEGSKDSKTGQGVSVKDLELTGKLRSITASKADAIGYVFRDVLRDQGALQVSFQSTELVACGSRCEHLKGQVFPFDWKKIYTEDKNLQ